MVRSEHIVLAERAMAEEEFERAGKILSALLHRDGRNETALRLQARCRLALEQPEEARKIYRVIEGEQIEFSVQARAEALLALGRDADALALLHKATDCDSHLLAAVACYRLGRIVDCLRQLEQFIAVGGEWQDEDAISPLLWHLLPRPEFLDFEQLYLDSQGNCGRATPSSQSRWFALNMPIYELYTAGNAQKRRARTLAFSRLLMPEEDVTLEAGRELLQQTLQDFAASQEDARFGLETLKQFDAGHYDQVAKNILSLELEHLAQFAEHIGMTAATVRDSQLQQIIPLLPYRIALCLMLLYAVSDSQDRLLQTMRQELEPEWIAALIFLGFKAFYQEFNRIQQRGEKAGGAARSKNPLS